MFFIFEIVNAIPDDAQLLVEIAEEALPACVGLLQRFPDNSAFDDIFSVISAFHTKIDAPNETMFTCLGLVLEIVGSDPDMMTSMQNIAYLTAPLILSPEFPQRAELAGLCCQAVRAFIDCLVAESDVDNLAYAVLLAGALILALGPPCFDFLSIVCEVPSLIVDESGTILYSACVFAASAALLAPGVDSSAALGTLPPELVDFIIAKTAPGVLQTYNEMKIGFLALLKFAEHGRVDAWSLCFQILPALAELRAEREMNREMKMRTARDVVGLGELNFAPLVIPFSLGPVETLDEFSLFLSLAAKLSLTPEQKAICDSIFS
jgi:hypothetical protein